MKMTPFHCTISSLRVRAKRKCLSAKSKQWHCMAYCCEKYVSLFTIEEPFHRTYHFPPLTAFRSPALNHNVLSSNQVKQLEATQSFQHRHFSTNCEQLVFRSLVFYQLHSTQSPFSRFTFSFSTVHSSEEDIQTLPTCSGTIHPGSRSCLSVQKFMSF